jgi:hypothetical protein
MIHALNLGLRFLLEIAALVAVGYWGFRLPNGLFIQVLGGIGLPVLIAILWAVFRVPGDGGAPIVAISGQLRPALEAVVFGVAIAALVGSGQQGLVVAFALVLALHYAVDHERTVSFLPGRSSVA